MTAAFRYFARPHTFSGYSAQPMLCAFCGEERLCYPGPFLGLTDEEAICEDCLVSGRLQGADLTTNNGDARALRRQLRERHPELSEAEVERLSRERTDEIEARTPSPLTWQDFLWPAHCGDYCRYIKEVGQPEIIALASDGDGPAYLLTHADMVSDLEHAREVWEGVRPDAPSDLTISYSVGVYLFECLVCGERILLWDCD
ncbi:MAG TPA: CbrC family protein [Ktedonobacterales bacterium]